MFEVQETSRAYGPTDTIPEGVWYMVSQHRNFSLARSRKHELDDDMRARCAPGSWDSHRRIIATRDYRRVEGFCCLGYKRADGTPHYCDQEASSAVYTWPASKIDPGGETPKGWSRTQCPTCRAAEQEASNQWLAEAEQAAADLADELETQQDAIGG